MTSVGMSVIFPAAICFAICFTFARRPRHLRADLAEADAVVLEAEDGVRPAGELAVQHLLDRRVDRGVDALHRARQHLRAEIRLVGVDADPPHVALLRGVEHAEPAAARDLEDDVRARGDLVQRGRLALRLVDPVLRVRVQELHARIGLARARLVAGDVAVDRRLLLAADRADRVLPARLSGGPAR